VDDLMMGLAIVDFEGEPRVLDVDVGRHLGMANPTDIRKLILRNAEDLSDFGILATVAKNHGGGRGRPTTEYLLNKVQALFIAGRSDTERGRTTYKMLVRAFDSYMRGELRQPKIPPLLAADYGDWKKTWQDDLMRHLCALRGEVFAGRQPRWSARINGVIYECLLGEDVYKELKQRNPKPSRGKNHHQLINGDVRDRFEKHLEFIGKLAAVSQSLRDFEHNLRVAYQGKALQLSLGAAE
jgi:P63C domain